MPPAKVLAPVRVSVPELIIVRTPPELVSPVAKVTPWPLVSMLYCWLAAALKRLE